jgi:mycofactocin biosynthetic radical S-adenosylmethionine protein MftC
MGLVERLTAEIERVPGPGKWLWRHESRLKRNYCLVLHKLGLLKPATFVQWLSTYQCNFSCPFCEASAGRKGVDELTTREVFALIDDLSRMGVKRFLISGGEPLQRPDLLQILEYADKRKLSFGLVSNGYGVQEKWPALSKFRYFLYFTSIDGPPEHHEKVRGMQESYARALKALSLFAQIGVPTRMVNTVVTAENLGMLGELLQAITSARATHWHLTPVASVGRAAGQDKYYLTGTYLRELLDFIRQHQRSDGLKVALGESHSYLQYFCGHELGKAHFCGAGLTRCAIMPNGDVLGCQQVYDASFAEGNIRNEPFSRIWKKKFQRFRKPAIPSSCEGCEFLGPCQGGCWAEMETQGRCLKDRWNADSQSSV